MSKSSNPCPAGISQAAYQWIFAFSLTLPAIATAGTEPAKFPLLSASLGAKPNIMLNIDNSGSMQQPYLDIYKVTNADKNNIEYYCNSLQYNVGPKQDYNGRYYCLDKLGYANYSAVAKKPATSWSGGYYAMRSAQVNALYYDPKITYKPRVAADGVSNYEALPTGFVTDTGSERLEFYWGTATVYYPSLTLVAASPSPAASFTYVNCTTFTNGSCQINNPATNVVTISTANKTATFTPPPANRRTDCTTNSNGTCTYDEERQNILNWYTYYRTRAQATATSIGFALANPEFNAKMRVGYFNINRYGSSSGTSSLALRPTTWSAQATHRGVREFTLGTSTNTRQVFNWLYGQSVYGGTPLHNAINEVGKYFSGPEPWASDPENLSAGTPLACRRSFNIMFSDGGWTSTSNSDYAMLNPDGTYTYSIPGSTYNTDRAVTDLSGAAITPAFTYKYKGGANYIPYPDRPGATSSYSLAAVAAYYYWNKDLRKTLTNEAPVTKNNPTYWQNMKTYTIGYGIAPTGFSFDDITQWITSYSESGYATDKIPNWPSGDLRGASDNARVDDFIHAGYTGGGFAKSVRTATEIERTFNIVISDALNSSGNDAGVSVSGSGSGFSGTFTNAQKFGVEYKTSVNSGDIKTYNLNEKGNFLTLDASGTPVPAWSANQKMPDYKSRSVYMRSASATGAVAATSETKLTDLPADLYSAINGSGYFKSEDSSFFSYLLGLDNLLNANGDLMRARESKIGAIVNAPPLYAGANMNMYYAHPNSSVTGKSSYLTMRADKARGIANIYAPSNDGLIHVIDTARAPKDLKTDLPSTGTTPTPGKEVAAYMPVTTMPKQANFADETFKFDYMVDGPLAEHDVFDGTNWRHLLIGSGGRGGKFAYALEAPLPAPEPAVSRIPGKQHFLWEKPVSALTHMGFVTNAATAGQLRTGSNSNTSDKWVVLMGSGHYATSADANAEVGLYLLDALDGSVVAFIAVPAKSRGLGGVIAVRDKNRRIVAAYAGDAGGNLWRFDLRPDKMAVSYGKPLFTAETSDGKPRAIYGAPAWQAHPGGSLGNDDMGKPIKCEAAATGATCGTIVVLGTGILLDKDDLSNTAKQALYGIWDPTPVGEDDFAGFTTVAASSLLEQTFTSNTAKGSGNANSDRTYFALSDEKIDWNQKHRGWKIELGAINAGDIDTTKGERVLSDAFNLGSSVFLTSSIVKEASGQESCTASQSAPNLIYGVNALSGGNKYSFDVNQDGKFSKSERYSVAYIPDGGYSQGSFVSKGNEGAPADGGTDPGTPKPPACPDGTIAGEGNICLKVAVDCTKAIGALTGTKLTDGVYDGCPSAGWRRTWINVINSPTF